MHQQRRFPIFVRLLVSLSLIVGLFVLLPPHRPVHAATEQARMADGPMGSFVDSIGVATHLTSSDGPYADLTGKVIPRLQEMGIRHVRDGFGYDVSGYTDRIRTLHDHGIGASLLWGSWSNKPSISDTVNYTAGLADILEAVEGPNEADLNNARFNYNGDGWDSNGNSVGQGWAVGLRNYMTDLYSALKADSRTAHLPVIMASMGWGKDADTFVGNPAWNGDEHSDYGNGHYYTADADPPSSALASWHIHYSREINPHNPLIVTEVGWSTATGSTCGTCISEWAQARYGMRAYLEHFSAGIQRSYMYELFDEGTDLSNDQDMYGLIKNDGTTYKPLASGLTNMISLLSDPGPAFTPGSLDYSLSGGDSTVHHLLLQKRDGTFYLIIWQDAKNYGDGSDIVVDPQNVTLSLATPIAQASTYEPLTNGTSVQQHYNQPTTITLAVPDHPLIVALSPPSGFSSGLESQDVQPTWTDSVDDTGGGIANVDRSYLDDLSISG